MASFRLQVFTLGFAIHALTSIRVSADCSDYNADNVPESLKPRLNAIVTAYCNEAGKTAKAVVVNSGQRTPKRQAALMMTCLQTSKGCPSYQNQEAYAEIKRAYSGNLTEETVVKTITAQVKRGCFISKHLSEYALDLERHTNDNSAKNASDCRSSASGDDATLASILENSVDVANVVFFEGGRCDHFHVNFSGFPLRGFATCPSRYEP